jgi:hypothetical protein
MKETWFFPKVVHLRLRDQSLLKFNPGPQELPEDLPELEKEILMRYGVKPIASASKQTNVNEELTVGASTEVKAGLGQQEESEGQQEDLVSKTKVSKKK